jgi:cytochrome c biogenesis factor
MAMPKSLLIEQGLGNMNALTILWDQVWVSPTLVWLMTALFSVVSAYILNTVVDDRLFATLAALAMFLAIMVANVAFTNLGIYFATNQNTNVIASVGAAACCLAVFATVIHKLWYAIFDLRHRVQGD